MPMKTLITTVTALAVLTIGTEKTFAGDQEWATAGKILTGLVIGGAVASALQPPPVFHAPAVVYTPPPVVYAPQPVVYTRPAVVAAPAPVYIQAPPAPVYVRPAPAPVVVYAPPPVYYVRPAPVFYYGHRHYVPRPVVNFHVGFGFGGHQRHHHHR